MERKKYTLITLLLFLLTTNISKADYKTQIYTAYISNDMSAWKKTIDEMDKITTKSKQMMLELVNYQYGYIAWCIGVEKYEEAEFYLDKADETIEYLEDEEFELSLIHAYQSAFFGFRIGISPYKAPILGPRSVGSAQDAIDLDKNNPYGYIQYGNCQYYMPVAFGGSKQVAIVYFTKAQMLMEADKEKVKNDWNYLSLLAMIAKAYTETNNIEKAVFYYEKILKIEPEFLWVKNELYPQLKKNNLQKK